MSKPLFENWKSKSSPALQAALYYARKRQRLIRIAASLGETGTEIDTENPDIFAAVGVATQFTPTTLTGATNGALSNGNLTYTANGNSASSGAVSTSSKTTGKWYFEVTLTDLQTGGQTGIALCDTSGTYADAGSSIATHGITEYLNSGDIYANGSHIGNGNGGQRDPLTGDVIGVSIDVDNKQVWYQNITSGGTRQGPLTPTSEANYEAMITTNASTANGAFTFNFGATAFAGTLPGGFAAWG